MLFIRMEIRVNGGISVSDVMREYSLRFEAKVAWQEDAYASSEESGFAAASPDLRARVTAKEVNICQRNRN